MAKFNVNQNVVRKSDGKPGIIRAREVKSVDNYTEVKYLVDFGDGIDNWSVVTKNDITSAPKNEEKSPFMVKRYDVGDGKSITIAARVNNVKTEANAYSEAFDEYYSYTTKGKILNIGFSIYNGSDDYNPEIGRKYAIHRCKTNPFTTMGSGFSGEFNNETVEAIMDVKAKYIIKNMDRFYRP
jgi:hypothetical protein